MQSSILFLASAMALISQATAGVISSREASIANLQIFGDDRCTAAESMGDFNLYSEDTDKCHTFPTDKAVNSVYISYINNGCAVYPQTAEIRAGSLTKNGREGLELRLAVTKSLSGLKYCQWVH
ncbi:ec86 [Fusarium subglutinans]|uniref:Ec86 n=1 Tax=Gibberella subglutinans TaxID=42677 RepID=A0A8H5Q7D7_GIBSU|nr:ec86 [Fusarium subglutinans]KAF5609614.1 ec86 [Fusarium subglutinans]